MSYQYDLVVIGCGPAGEKGGARAAYHGKKVAIVERADLGGAGINTGTLPSCCGGYRSVVGMDS